MAGDRALPGRRRGRRDGRRASFFRRRDHLERRPALAGAHAALALKHFLQPDPHAAERENSLALAAAERAGDAFLIIRIRINNGFGYLDLGRFADAQTEFEAALKLVELVGLPSFHALALTGRASAATGLARFEEALSDFRAARTLFGRTGSRWVAHTHLREGNLHLLRGELMLARRGFEDAIRIAEQSGDRQVLVPALAGLAEALALLLERDAFDEQAHLGLVASLAEAGRHGEARRRYGLYASRMDELGIEAAAFPVVARVAEPI